MKKTIYALGYFDGVHLGHQALLQSCRELSGQTGCQCGVVTFSGHPDALLSGKDPGLINTAGDRRRLLTWYGAEAIVELPFDRALMQTPWQTFLDTLLRQYDAAGFVCGTDFRFGSGGEGTAQKLEQFCQEQGLYCRLTEQQYLGDIRISSTHIRGLLEQGKLHEAESFLGHPHILTGTVVKGNQLGRTIGVPTANLAYPQELLDLPHGVYACQVEVEGKQYTAVTNIGTRPTVAGQSVTAESWLLDFSAELYGRQIKIIFHKFLRPERKFESLCALKEQILLDAQAARGSEQP